MSGPLTVRRYAIPRASLPSQAEPLSDGAVHALLMEHQRRETDAFWSGILGVPYKPDDRLDGERVEHQPGAVYRCAGRACRAGVTDARRGLTGTPSCRITYF